jgi:ribosomal protein S18 acetylase RimI-like enzyme
MVDSNAMVGVRPCRLGDVPSISRLLKVSWHATYDSMVGQRAALKLGRVVYSTGNLAIWIAQSRWSPRFRKMLVATRGDMAVGFAMARIDASEIVLWMLYVDPERKGQGIGSALLRTVADSYAEAKSMRVEVLRDNVAAIAWYKAQGFEVYGEAKNATAMPGVAALYMDKKLDRVTQPS